MSSIRAITILTMLILFAVLAAGAQAVTVTVAGGSIPAAGQAGDFPVTVDILPEGLSGFQITVSLDDPSKAEIVEYSYPSWAEAAILKNIGPLPRTRSLLSLLILNLWRLV